MTKQERRVSRWGLLTAGGKGPIVAGDEDGCMRTSTPLVEFDAATLTGVTSSGRPYRLEGPSDEAHAIRCFLSLWDPGEKAVTTVHPEAAIEVIAANGNAPFRFGPKEAARLARLKVEHCAAQIAAQVAQQGLTLDEAAAAAAIERFKLDAILKHDTDAVTADEADEASVALIRRGLATYR